MVSLCTYRCQGSSQRGNQIMNKRLPICCRGFLPRDLQRFSEAAETKKDEHSEQNKEEHSEAKKEEQSPGSGDSPILTPPSPCKGRIRKQGRSMRVRPERKISTSCTLSSVSTSKALNYCSKTRFSCGAPLCSGT